MRKSPTKYSDDEKLRLLREYHESGLSKYAFAKQRNLCGSILLNKWMQKYETEEKSISLQPEPNEDEMAKRSKDSYKDENTQLKKRIKELEKALEFSRLETLARDMMIDKAEEYFDKKKKKKSGAK